jgi:iron complex transport system substrate-binding protein
MIRLLRRRGAPVGAALLACALLSVQALSAAPAKARRIFTDSAGRSVELPAKIERIAPSGALAQIVLYSLVPERVVGWCQTPPELVKKYMPQRYWSLPTFGTYYGKNANLNLEALIAAKPDLIIDIGEAKKNVKGDMDTLQSQLGIPVVFIEAHLDTFAQAYTALGELTGEKEAAARLAAYCAKAVGGAREAAASIPASKRLKVYYGEGKTGLETNPRGSIHADVIDLVGAVNVADIPITSGAGGNQITREQLLIWNPDIIILGPESVYGKLRSDPMWKDLAAVKAGRVYEIPNGPYDWMGRPPAVNRLIGIYWLGGLVYPDKFPGDLESEAREFYRLFYHYELSDSEFSDLVAKSR